MISNIFWSVGIAFVMFEIFGMWRRTPAHCDCSGDFWLSGARHLKSWGLYVVGVCYSLSAVTYTGSLAGRAAESVFGVIFLYRAWSHSKNGRKKLKDKVLGVVRATAAGLKVVPEPGGSAA